MPRISVMPYTTAHKVVCNCLETHYRYEKKQYDRKVQNQQFAMGQAAWLINFPENH